MGLIDKTFAIDTIGEYCQCNLIDSSSTVKNPNGLRPAECETCEYKMMAECHPCGSEMQTSCNWTKEFVRALIEIKQVRETFDATIKNNNLTKNCNCSDTQKKKTVFCVRDYIL